MNKKTLVMLGVAVLAAGAFAKPHGHAGGPRPRPARIEHRAPPRAHVKHHHSVWGRGGRHFLPGFVGGVVGGAIVEATVGPRVVKETVVVQQPVVVETVPAPVAQTETRNVWVPGRYVDQVQPNGTIVRVWQSGHYEVQTTVVYVQN